MYNKKARKNETNMHYIKIDEQIYEKTEKQMRQKKYGKNVVVPRGYQTASPERDLAPREAEK